MKTIKKLMTGLLVLILLTVNMQPALAAEPNYTIEQIAAGGYHSLALKPDGTVWAWGYNDNGQLGDRTRSDRSTPVQVSNLRGMLGSVAGGMVGGAALSVLGPQGAAMGAYAGSKIGSKAGAFGAGTGYAATATLTHDSIMKPIGNFVHDKTANMLGLKVKNTGKFSGYDEQNKYNENLEVTM